MLSSGKQETLYHLLPTGWVPEGDPPDRVETWCRTVRPDASVSWRCAWVGLKKTLIEREALRLKHHAFLA
jgi:hypothetical protein